MGGLPAGPGFTLPPPMSLFKEQQRQQETDMPTNASQTTLNSRKGLAWTEAEHSAFMKGLQSFGKGQWKQISRYYVPSRTPTQVASHAQKHFLRVKAGGVGKRRSRFAVAEQGAATASVELRAEHIGYAASSFALGASFCPAGDVLPQCSAAAASTVQVALPPVSANGVAVGIPVPTCMPGPQAPPASASGCKLPMLPVLPGRIKALTYLDRKPRSPQPHQQPAPQQQPHNVSAAARHAQLGHLDDLRDQLRSREPRERRQRPGGSGAASASSEISNSPHAALDALAGLAAALADSAASS